MTVARAYQELKNHGLIEGRPGSGTFVADAGKPLPRGKGDAVDLHRRIDQLIDECVALKLRPADLARMISARMSERRPTERPKDLVIIGNFMTATADYATTINEVLGGIATVQPLVIDDVRANSGVRKRAAAADLVLTFAHRRHEVIELLPSSTVVAISFIPSETTRLSLASLDPLARVLVVSIFPEFTPLMKVSVQRFAPHVADITITMPDALNFDLLLRGADVLVYATGADSVLPRCPAGTPSFEFRHTPDPGDVKRVVLPIIAPAKTAGRRVARAK